MRGTNALAAPLTRRSLSTSDSSSDLSSSEEDCEAVKKVENFIAEEEKEMEGIHPVDFRPR